MVSLIHLVCSGMKLHFGLLPKDQPFYDADRSGIALTPASGSNVNPKNRIHFPRHHASTKFFNVPNIRDMTTRFLNQLADQLASPKDIGTEWIELPDLATFIHKEVFRAATYSICGPYLLSLSPTFVDDFADYIFYLPIYNKAWPLWMQPRAYATRDRLLEAYKKWHRFAQEHSPLKRNRRKIGNLIGVHDSSESGIGMQAEWMV